MADSNYSDIRSLYHSNYLSTKYCIHFSPNYYSTATITTTDAIDSAPSAATTNTSWRLLHAGKSDTPPLNVKFDTNKPHNVISDVLHGYQTRLKNIYENYPEISTQGWFDDSVQKQLFINITLKKELKNNKEDYHSTTEQAIIKGETAYEAYKYVYYDKIFQVNCCSTFQLFLLEGDAGTGKTSLAYRICKLWARGDVLQQYSCIILVELRNLKSGTKISLETLVTAVGQSIHDETSVCSEIDRTLGHGILIWLEGWDEIDTSFVTDSAFDTLLHGKLLPHSHVVITTRPSATRTLFKKFRFAHKFKLIGFDEGHVKKYVTRYCANTDDPCLNLEKFMDHLNATSGLSHLAKVPFFLAILVKLFKANRKLPHKLTHIYIDFLKICLQHYKEKNYRDYQPITDLNDLPTKMHRIFKCMQKCAYEQFLFHTQLTEKEISDFFNGPKVPDNFDGFGLFNVILSSNTIGISKIYYFKYKPIQEMLATLYLKRLEQNNLITELSDTFGKKALEMVWVFYAGLTGLNRVTLQNVLVKHRVTVVQKPLNSFPAKSLTDLVKAWRESQMYYMNAIKKNIDFFLLLIMCCYEADNSEACRDIANHFYTEKVCRFEIPPNHATPYLLLAVSYFIRHSGKTWSLRCNTVHVVQSSVELLFTHYHINDSKNTMTNLWVFCCVVTPSDIDTYCNAIKSQSSLQWIHLLPGSSLGDNGTYKLCNHLNFNSQMLKVELDECDIGNEGLKYIGHMLKINRSILCLHMRKNSFTLEGLKEFLQCIKNQQYLQNLCLDKKFCENIEINAILEDINAIRTKNNADPLMLTHR